MLRFSYINSLYGNIKFNEKLKEKKKTFIYFILN
jgi:hypothetical protein